jgi:hypothetical protein
MPHSARELDGLNTLEAMEVKTIPLKSSFQLVMELVVAHGRSSVPDPGNRGTLAQANETA